MEKNEPFLSKETNSNIFLRYVNVHVDVIVFYVDDLGFFKFCVQYFFFFFL